jgi:Protein of unknown function (DUF2867)
MTVREITPEMMFARSPRWIEAPLNLLVTHKWLGRTYLSVIVPFHRLIARALLRQVAG